MLSSPELEKNALDHLKGKENPFDSLARPQRQDDSFLDLHVPELLAAERKLLLKIIDHYRVETYTRSSDLPPTRVVTIRGDRGTGKTHLLQSIPYRYREDGKSQILVRPSYYDRNLPFDEFLLGQLVSSLEAEDEVFHSRPIEDIAAAITRRLLRQAIHSLGPTDRLFALCPDRWKRIRLLLGGAEKECEVFDRLVEALETSGPLDLANLLRRLELKPEQCFRIVHGHLRKYEIGPDLPSVLRRTLYSAMARSALLQESEPLFRLLGGEYTQLENGSSTRSEIVSRLLHALSEVCALVRQPIVFAFDNLEGLLNPQTQIDEGLIRSFWNKLAQTIDKTRGLLILLFAESGLFEHLASYMDGFAQDRLEQGVPVPGKGPENRIVLNPPNTEEIKVLVKSRVNGLLGDFPWAQELPEAFPFDEKTIQGSVVGYQSLRNTLRRLRDYYSQKVYEKTPAIEKETTINWESLFESTWNDQISAANRMLEGGLASHIQKFHAGLGSLLQKVLPFAVNSWELTEVLPTASIGDNPTYGVVSVLTWKHQNGSVADGALTKVGIGFLLARGTGMPNDLRAKFDFFRRPTKGDRLLVFWPSQNDREDLVELLPDGTRAVWNESRHKKKTNLRKVEKSDLCTLLAFPQWLNAIQAAADQPVPPEVLQAFIKERFQSLLQLMAPPVLQEERVLANDN
jgi:hypothetical protein